MEEFDYKLKHILEIDNKIIDTISRMHPICDESTIHSNDIFYSKSHNMNFNDIISDIIFLDNFLEENKDIFKYDYSLEYKVISNYQQVNNILQYNSYCKPTYTIARITKYQYSIILRNNKIYILSILT